MANLSCDRVKDLLTDLHEGALQQALRIPVEAHLKECEGCRADLDGIALVYAALQDAPDFDAPHNLRATVWSRIEAQETSVSVAPRPPFSLRSLFMRPVFGVSAAAVLLLVVGGLVIPGRYMTAGYSTRGGEAVQGPGSLLRPGAAGTLSNSPGGQYLVVPLTAPASSAVKVEAALDGAAANGGNTVATNVSKGDTSLRLGPVVPLPASSSIRAELRWTENGTAHKMSVTAGP